MNEEYNNINLGEDNNINIGEDNNKVVNYDNNFDFHIEDNNFDSQTQDSNSNLQTQDNENEIAKQNNSNIKNIYDPSQWEDIDQQYSVERSFLKLKLIKSYLRLTMSQQKLNILILLSIKKYFLNKINYDNLIDNFTSQKKI